MEYLDELFESIYVPSVSFLNVNLKMTLYITFVSESQAL